MRLTDLPRRDVVDRARTAGLSLRMGPFVVRMRTGIEHVLDAWRLLYGDFPLDEGGGLTDFDTRLTVDRGIRRLARPRVVFSSDRRRPYAPQPLTAALAMFEWGLNWCVYSQAHHFCIIHAAAVERGGRVLLLPAPPNAGKSTLCAALIQTGWRLLSDEFGLLQPADGLLAPLPRPVSLKNASGPLISALFPDAVFGPSATQTPKGAIVHMRPSSASVARALEAAPAGWVVFPRYDRGAQARLEPLPRGRALLSLVENTLNYGVLGRSAFEALSRLVDDAACYTLTFDDPMQALSVLDDLPADAPARAELSRSSTPSMTVAPAETDRGEPELRVPTTVSGSDISPVYLVLAVCREPEIVRTFSLSAWDVLIRQARRARVLGRLAARLEEHHLLETVPVRARPHLEAMQRLAAENQRIARWEVKRIRRALTSTGVPLTLLKGTAYVFANLPVARGRPLSDVDILVPKSALAEVEARLLAHGWEHVKVDPYDQRYYRRWMHELPPMRHRERWTVLDVHHTILPESGRVHPDPRRLLASARTLEGSDVRVLAPSHMILHTAAHLFQDGDLQGGLGDLLDLDALLRHFGGSADFWDTLAREARTLQLTRPLFYALRYTTALLGTPARDGVLATRDGPGPLFRVLMDGLVTRALVVDHPEHADWGAGVARWLLYARSHWLRMPPWLLAHHLMRKSLRRGQPVLVGR